MKQFQIPISPFIILLIPVILMFALLLLNGEAEEESERLQSFKYFRMPEIHCVRALF